MDLPGKTALVTGSGVRVGKALALALAREGARVVVHYHASEGPARHTVADIEALGGEAVAIQADLSQFVQVTGLAGQAVAHFGQLDILINSAAIFERADLAHTTEELWDRQFAINLKAPFFLSQAFAAQVGPEQSAHIINIADWRAMRPDINYVAYTLTKSGLLTMTHALALDLAPNIQVNALALGAILPPPGKGERYFERLAQEIPAQRVGSPADVAQAMVFLLESSFVTGEALFVTGGEHL